MLVTGYVSLGVGHLAVNRHMPEHLVTGLCVVQQLLQDHVDPMPVPHHPAALPVGLRDGERFGVLLGTDLTLLYHPCVQHVTDLLLE